jgi:hypothetical protein
MNPPSTATERKNLLLKHPDISTWIKDRSPGTASTQLDHLRIFLEHTHLDTDSLVRLAKNDERALRNVVIDFIHDRQDAGLKTKYVGNIWWSVRSFLRSVNAAPEWNPSVRDTDADEVEGSRAVPTHEQVRQIANATKSARDRMVVLVLASSSVRIGTFATQNGNVDGLRLKNLIDLKLESEPHFERNPPMLRIPAHLAKANVGYYTGLTEEAGEAVITYLRERMHRGEALQPDSPLVVPDARGVRESRKSKDGFELVMRKSLGARVQAAMDAVAPKGVRWVPHSLRAFASTALEAAEARGVISRTRRFYFTAHAIGSVDSRYNLSRPLSPQKVEELRDDWRKVLPFLDLSQTERRQEDTKAALLADIARAIEKAQTESGGTATLDQLARILRDGLRAEGNPAKSPAAPESLPQVLTMEQRIVKPDQVSSFLSKGWTFRSSLNDSLAVIERPIGLTIPSSAQ